jgi:DNA-binding response OmpR family regulator
MPHTATNQPDEADISAPTILVVEDEVLVRLAISDYLRECGYKVFEAGDVAEAKSVLAADVGVDVVFTDVQMPGAEDGFALAAWTREHNPAVQVIITSGWSGADRKARDLCHDGPIMPKPYEQDAVLRRIQELVRKRRASL